MKTRDLIAALQRADPSGELEACVGNHEILSVYTEFAGYDGRVQVAGSRNDEGRPTSIRITNLGSKVQIEPFDLEGELFDDPAFPVEIAPSDPYTAEKIERWREDGRQFRRKHPEAE
jgi:hypothetical protein